MDQTQNTILSDLLHSATQMAEYKQKLLLCSFASNNKDSHYEQENIAPRLTFRLPHLA